MNSEDTVIQAIAAAAAEQDTCGQCNTALDDTAVSSLFCSERCQRAWHGARTADGGELAGYVDPWYDAEVGVGRWASADGSGNVPADETERAASGYLNAAELLRRIRRRGPVAADYRDLTRGTRPQAGYSAEVVRAAYASRDLADDLERFMEQMREEPLTEFQRWFLRAQFSDYPRASHYHRPLFGRPEYLGDAGPTPFEDTLVSLIAPELAIDRRFDLGLRAVHHCVVVDGAITLFAGSPRAEAGTDLSRVRLAVPDGARYRGPADEAAHWRYSEYPLALAFTLTTGPHRQDERHGVRVYGDRSQQFDSDYILRESIRRIWPEHFRARTAQRYNRLTGDPT